ncbi:MAG: RNA 2',3'-cyclic phosphodiesterase [Planctomycetota bacterium]
MAKTRTFVAIGVTPAIRAAATGLVDRLGRQADGLMWVDAANLHYTLQFLGNITDQEIADVCRLVQEAADTHDAFSLEACGVGAFPSIDRPRTLWVGAGEGSERLESLAAEVESALADLGFRGENRRFVPHMTIGKLARGRTAPASLATLLGENQAFNAGTMAVRHATVYASQLAPQGPEYHVLARCPLG